MRAAGKWGDDAAEAPGTKKPGWISREKSKANICYRIVFKQTPPRLQNEKFSITETLKAFLLSILLYCPLKKNLDSTPKIHLHDLKAVQECYGNLPNLSRQFWQIQTNVFKCLARKHFSGDVILFIRPTDTNKEPKGLGKQRDWQAFNI